MFLCVCKRLCITPSFLSNEHLWAVHLFVSLSVCLVLELYFVRSIFLVALTDSGKLATRPLYVFCHSRQLKLKKTWITLVLSTLLSCCQVFVGESLLISPVVMPQLRNLYMDGTRYELSTGTKSEITNRATAQHRRNTRRRKWQPRALFVIICNKAPTRPSLSPCTS